MLGVLITFLFAVGAMGVGQFLLRRWTSDIDRAEAAGIHGLAGLGVLGLLTLFVGLAPQGLKWGLFIVGAVAAAGFVSLIPSFRMGDFKFAKPQGPTILFVVAIALAGLFALIGALAPSDLMDWDSLAYHLAVPKIWLLAGHIDYIPYIHQSNFPFTVENLYIWGLTWGDQSGAKAFSVVYLLLGSLAIFGFARRRYSELAGWWAALGFATVPVVLWESGTGYIDVAHGLYGGLGVLYAARFMGKPETKSNLLLSALFLGFAAGTKYTGLQTIGVTALVLLIGFGSQMRATEGFRSAILVGLLAVAVACPWYVKTFGFTGNPVFPFFFERLGGKNWDQRRADVYRNEQQQFGAGSLETRHNPTQLGSAVLGLAYQPGRYVNPGESKGLGTPLGAVGVVILTAAVLWALSGKLEIFESTVLGIVGVSILMWFFLSQQSRYVVPLAVPLAVLAGGAVVRLKLGKLMAGVVALQAAYSFYLVYTQRFETQLQVVLGKVSADDFQNQSIPFYEAAQEINKDVGDGKVALYDEVFGYLLDVPYVWANPPHSMLIPYDSLHNGAEYVAAMKKLGFTHIYISTSSIVKDREFVKRWIAAMGLNGPPAPFPASDQAMLATWDNHWMALLTDAVVQKLVVPVKGFKHGILFKIL